MRLHRRPTRWLCSWLAVLLLFMQLAMSAYACPAELPAPPLAAGLADMPGCDGDMPLLMDPDQPQLCQAHCQQGAQTLQPSLALDAPALPLLLAVLDWTAALRLPRQPCLACRPAAAPGAAPPGAPPLYIALLVLRN